MRASTVAAGVAQRARIVLLAAEGSGELRDRGAGRGDAADGEPVARPVCASGAGRAGRGQAAGAAAHVDRAKVITATLTPPPKSLGVTHWSSGCWRTGWGSSTPRWPAIWKEYGVKPWKAETFKFSTDPELVAKVIDVVGLYLAPPENAIVLCVDEKSPDPSAEPDRRRCCRCSPGMPSSAPTTTSGTAPPRLFAALEIATGKVTGLCKQRHRHQEFLAFLKHVARAYPDVELHLVMDNYAAHKRVEVRDWLAANPRIHVHFTPTSGSWLNLVEVWFGIIERQAIRRGSFTSVRDLDDQDPRLHHRLEPPQAPVHLDQTRRRDPQKGQPKEDFKQAALGPGLSQIRCIWPDRQRGWQ